MVAFQRPRTVTEGVRQHLRQDLLTGGLAPGAWLREQEIAERLQVSRTPVREAFRLLAQEGLLEIHPNRGVRVPEIRLEEAVASYSVRVRLETMAAALAAGRVASGATADAEATLRGALDAIQATPIEDRAGHLAADDAFHATVAELSGNPVLREFIDQLNARARRVKIVTRDVNVSELATRQHRAIAEAILRGDAAGAEAAMSDHVHANLAIVRGRLQGRLDPADPSIEASAGAPDPEPLAATVAASHAHNEE